jgi:DNA-binding transcriptional ArsR family regulator
MAVQTRRELTLDSKGQLKALADRTRSKILRILEDAPASAKQLSAMLSMTHGRVGHHLKVLRDAGLIKVVEERQVRAVSERFYGLSHDSLRFAVDSTDRLGFLFGQASQEAAPSSRQPFEPPGMFVTARLKPQAVQDFHKRLLALVAEFHDAADPDGSDVFGMVGAVFTTDMPPRSGS